MGLEHVDTLKEIITYPSKEIIGKNVSVEYREKETGKD